MFGISRQQIKRRVTRAPVHIQKNKTPIYIDEKGTKKTFFQGSYCIQRENPKTNTFFIGGLNFQYVLDLHFKHFHFKERPEEIDIKQNVNGKKYFTLPK